MPVAGGLEYLDARPRPGSRGRGTLLLLHAFPLNAGMWESQLATFADRGWRVVAPHYMGSDPNGTKVVPLGSDPTVDEYAGRIIDLLDVLHVHEAVVLGCSMGGYVALAMMRLAPRYIQALVLVDTRPQADTPEGLANRDRMAQLARDRGVGAVADEMVPKLVGDTTKRERPEIVARVRALAQSSSLDGVLGALHAMKTRPDSTPLLASIHVPTLIMVGEEDGITPPAVSEAMRNAIAGSQLEMVARAGHLPNLEQPAAFNDALARFLEHRV